MGIKQGIVSKFKAKNSNAKYKLTYRSYYGQTLRGSKLTYSSSKLTTLSYKGN